MDYPIDLGIDEELAERLSSYFSPERIESLARQTKFIERSSSRLTGQMFLQMNVFNIATGKDRSLSDDCDYLEDTYGLKLQKQSLDERYNTYAVAFMKQSYETLLKEVLQPYLTPIQQQTLSSFNGIELVDATSFDLSSQLSVFYKGGGNVNSSIKIHHRYELLSGETLGLKIVSGHENDACFLSDLNTILVDKRLYIKDLGYYSLEHLQKIQNAGSYFLSRNKSSTNCYIKNDLGEFEEVEMKDLVPTYGENTEIETIYLGKQKLKVRMIIESVPQEHFAKRQRKKQRQNETRNAQSYHENTWLLCSYNVYITNADIQLLPTELTRLLYALRWQIEIIFKIWKSVFDIDKVKQMTIFRFQCYLYGRLMAILLSQKIQNLFKDYLWQQEELEISELKTAKIIKKNSRNLE